MTLKYVKFITSYFVKKSYIKSNKFIHSCNKNSLNTYYVLINIIADDGNTVVIKADKSPALLELWSSLGKKKQAYKKLKNKIK